LELARSSRLGLDGSGVMKKLILVAGLVAALGSLGACATGYEHPYGGERHYMSPEPTAYDGYYDNYYGAFYDGYWAGDGSYYYSTGEGRPYQRDTGGHFTHASSDGYHAVHGTGAGRHMSDGHDDGGHDRH
jgi:hypothetical protein